MENNKKVKFDDKVMAFGALGLLLAEAVPGASFKEGHTGAENCRMFRLTIPAGAELSEQTKLSLGALMDSTDNAMKRDVAGKQEYMFWLFA